VRINLFDYAMDMVSIVAARKPASASSEVTTLLKINAGV